MNSPRRKKFAAEYVKNGFNGVQAIYAAGYKQGYNSACTEAWRLLRNAEVQKLVSETLKKSKISADEVMEELSTIARAPVEKVTESGKLKALELTGKAYKLFTDRVEHSAFTEAFGKLRAEFPEVPEPELKSWFAELTGTQDLGNIG